MVESIYKNMVYTPYLKKRENGTFNIDLPEISTSTNTKSNTTTQEKDWRSDFTPTESVKYTPVTTSTITPVASTTTKRGTTVYKTEGMNIGRMQALIDKFNDAGINIRVTSGYRPGAVTKSTGKPSRHSSGEAIDITPIEGETFDSLRKQIFENQELVKWLRDNNYSWIDETTPEAMAKHGSTGQHLHWDVNSQYHNSRWNEYDKQRGIVTAKLGGILKLQFGGFPLFTLNTNKPTTFTSNVPSQIEGYAKQYNLSRGKGPLKKNETVNKSSQSNEDWHDKLYRFTKSYETFSPDKYQLNGQWLIGYGSANSDLVNKGTVSEQEADEQMKKDFTKIEKTLKANIKNWDALSDGVKIAMMDTAYNGGEYGFLKNSPKLMKMLNSGITDGRMLARELNHSQSKGGWLSVRSKARQAIAADDYDWNWKDTDKYGRYVDKEKTSNKDWQNSPYYNYTYNGGY